MFRQWFSRRLKAPPAKLQNTTAYRYNRINPNTLQCIPVRTVSEAACTELTELVGVIGQVCGSPLIGVLNCESVLRT